MVLDAGAQMLHYDVMDGHFVPNISFGVPVLKSLHKTLPDAFYDVHLMISHPLQYAEPFIKAGATLSTSIWSAKTTSSNHRCRQGAGLQGGPYHQARHPGRRRWHPIWTSWTWCW